MINVIILAAGLGDRLGDLTEDRPKALVPVAGRALIRYVLDFLALPAIGKKTVITGYRGKQLEQFLQTHAPDVATIHNPHFEAGSILSLAAAGPALTQPFLLMNVDHLYPRRMLHPILEHTHQLTAVCDFDRQLGPDDMKIRLSTAGKLAAIRKTLHEYDGGYIGMTCCGEAMLPHYRQAIHEVIDEHGEGAPVEWVLGHLAKRDHAVAILDVSGMGWLEVDTPEDLARAETALGQRNLLS